MEEFIRPDILTYSIEHSTPESPIFKQLHDVTYAKTSMPQMQVGPLEGGILRLLASTIQAKRIIEIGTFTGYSSLCLAEALPESGTLITCDVDPVATQIAQEYWQKTPHARKIQLKLRPALETLDELIAQGQTGKFDMAFIDADKENYARYYEKSLILLRKDGLIVIDNTLWSGRVLLPLKQQDSATRAISQLNDFIHRDSRVEHVLLPIRDGMMLVRKIETT